MMTESKLFGASRPIKYASSFVVFYCDFAVGLVYSIVGPALLSFSHKYGEDVDVVSKILTVSSACYLVGALSAGILFRFADRHKVAVIVLSWIAAAIAFLPHMPSLTSFFVMGGVFGFGIGIFDPAQIAWIIEIWGHEAGPFILSQHFTYSLGTLASPLLLAPFLPDGEKKNGTAEFTTAAADLLPHEDASLAVPFAVAGGLMLIGVIALTILYIVMLRTGSHSNGAGAQHEELPSSSSSDVSNLYQSSSYESSLTRKVIILALCSSFIGFYQAMEMSTMQFLSTFAHFSEVKLSETAGAQLLSALAIAFAVGRGVGIILVLRIAPHLILCMNGILMLVGNTILFVKGGESVPWLWAGSICLGAGFSTTYPAFYAYVEKYIFISNTVASIITVCAGTMAAIYPLIIGGFVERMPEILNYADYASMAVAILSFVLMFRFTYFRKPFVQQLDE